MHALAAVQPHKNIALCGEAQAVAKLMSRGAANKRGDVLYALRKRVCGTRWGLGEQAGIGTAWRLWLRSTPKRVQVDVRCLRLVGILEIARRLSIEPADGIRIAEEFDDMNTWPGGTR